MRTDSVYVYPVHSPSTGTAAISLKGSRPVIVMTSKALGGPHTHTHTHKHTESERDKRQQAHANITILKQLDSCLPSTCYLPWKHANCSSQCTNSHTMNPWNAFFQETNANYLQLKQPSTHASLSSDDSHRHQHKSPTDISLGRFWLIARVLVFVEAVDQHFFLVLKNRVQKMMLGVMRSYWSLLCQCMCVILDNKVNR